MGRYKFACTNIPEVDAEEVGGRLISILLYIRLLRYLEVLYCQVYKCADQVSYTMGHWLQNIQIMSCILCLTCSLLHMFNAGNIQLLGIKLQ